MLSINFHARDSALQLPTIAELTQAGNWSFSCWFRLLGTPPQSSTLIEHTAGSSNRIGVRLETGSGGGRIAAIGFDGSYAAWQTVRGGFQDGRWHHLVVNWNGRDPVFFVDGHREQVQSVTGGGLSFSRQIGRQAAGSTPSWHTQADTRIYDRPLSQQEISNIHAERFDSPTTATDWAFRISPEFVGGEPIEISGPVGGVATWENYDRRVLQRIDDLNEGLNSIYAIGNSLTVDASPQSLLRLGDRLINESQSLQFHFANPTSSTNDQSLPWETALNTRDYDVLMAQPFPESVSAPQAIDRDLEPLRHWIELQPDSVVLIHEGFAQAANVTGPIFNEPFGGNFAYSESYFEEIVRRLRVDFPLRDIRRSRTNAAMRLAAQRIESGDSPLNVIVGSVNQADALYRDFIHANLRHGRYLVHNCVRRSLGLPPNRVGEFSQSFQSGAIDPAIADWCDGVIDDVFSPSVVVPLLDVIANNTANLQG